MSEILKLVRMIFAVLLASIALYDTTEEGHAAIQELLAEVEKDGFDIPFWEPEQQPEGQPQPLDLYEDINGDVISSMAARFLSRHPQTKKGGE